MTLFGKSVPFFKMQGCGNDFVVVDNRRVGVSTARMADWAVKVCARAFGVYADGLFFLNDAPRDSGVDYRWDFYNSDGSRAEMCGNAARCAGKLAHALGLAPAMHVLGTDMGPIRVRVLETGPDAGQVKVQLTPATGLRTGWALTVAGKPLSVHYVNTGVPHAVVFVPDVEAVAVAELGPALRYHEAFAPAGANANFAQVLDTGHTRLRTYERGVEAETYACGTGAAATQLLAHHLGLTQSAARLTTTGGEVLTVSVEGGEVFLQGAAVLTFKGEFYPGALGL